jgi:hypothetical protein
MSIHQNPDTSLTEGMKIEPNGTFVAHAFVAVSTSAVGIGASVAAAVTTGARQASCQAAPGAVNILYRLDGTNPTTSVGVVIPAGQSVTLNMQDAAAALFIAASATTLVVTYTM